MQIALVLWNGGTGGAETFTASLCKELRSGGVDAGVVFVTTPHPLARRLEGDGIPYSSVGVARGAHVLVHPRTLARAVAHLGRDGAITASPGYLTAALRIGGYRARLVAVNHGRLLQLPTLPRRERAKRRLDRLSGRWATDVEVAVSDFMLRRLEQEPFHASRIVRIYNGLDLTKYDADGIGPLRRRAFRIAWAGRMIPGKGVDDLLRAFASLPKELDTRLRLAGDGPERLSLETLARELGVDGRVEFTGWSDDVPSFWRSADVAVIPSHQFVESFGMAAVEAMACGRPVVVSRNGGLTEVVDAGKTGEVFAPGDLEALAHALASYASDEPKRIEHGREARSRSVKLFGIDRAARSYLELFSAS
jgi:glycosyltransferase involved in cell wall biosynthesis